MTPSNPERRESADLAPGGRTQQRVRIGRFPRSHDAIRWLRARCFDAAWALWTLVFAPVIPVLWLVRPPSPTIRKITRIWARGTLAELRWITGVKFREIGREHVPSVPCLIVCNHQSAWETVAALLLFPDVAIVAKRELLRIPVLGWFLRRSPMIVIERDGSARTLRNMVAECVAALAQGRSILIFPEGTRKKPGERIEFRRGLALLYRTLRIPVLPVVVNSGWFWDSETGAKRPGEIAVVYLEPIGADLEASELINRATRLMQAEKEKGATGPG